MLDRAFAQIPDAHRYGNDILIRSDSAGASYAFLDHIRSLREDSVRSLFSVGAAVTDPVRAAIMPAWTGCPRSRPTGTCVTAPRSPSSPTWSTCPHIPSTRMIVRRERPHPGAQLSLFDTVEGMRHQVFITDTPAQPLLGAAAGTAPHSGHARVGIAVTPAKTAASAVPSRMFAINAAWLQLALIGIDLLAWPRTLALAGEHALAEPKKLRYRLLHVSARIVAAPNEPTCVSPKFGPGRAIS